MGRRTVLLVVAILVAAMGTGLIFAYVNRADERAKEGQEQVQVLVAKTLIKAGTVASTAEREGAFARQEIPRDATVEGYLTDTRSIATLVAVADIYPGEQIIPAKFAAAGATNALAIQAGDVAMSVQLGDPQRVAGFVRPGSQIAVLVTLPAPKNEQAVAGGDITRVLLPKVDVLAIGPTTLQPSTDGRGNAEQLPTAILTLSVNQEEAQKLAFAVDKARLYFTLLTKDSKVVRGESVHLNNLFS
jgi:pilus assembly protein CpaB